MIGTFLYHAHRCIQRATLPIREWRSKRAVKALLADLNRQEAEAVRKHRAVEPIRAAKRARMIRALTLATGAGK